MNKSKISIAIMEPSDIIFEGLSNMLLKYENHFYLFRINDIEELNELCLNENYDIVIINPNLVQNNVSGFIKLQKKYSKIAWIAIIYSLFDNGLLNKFNRTISIGDSSDSIKTKLDSLLSKEKHQNIHQEQLSAREIDILTQLVKGFTNQEIADKLYISIHTVISHRKNITEKTGIKSLSGLTIYAISKKIINLDNIDN
jgi:DNA-binding CsgD family transcriptional regulator